MTKLVVVVLIGQMKGFSKQSHTTKNLLLKGVKGVFFCAPLSLCVAIKVVSFKEDRLEKHRDNIYADISSCVRQQIEFCNCWKDCQVKPVHSSASRPKDLPSTLKLSSTRDYRLPSQFRRWTSGSHPPPSHPNPTTAMYF